jgi:glycine cleavage system transcriptional repressor
MPKNIVLTLTGPDRVGIVDELTGILLARGGNVETSRMARLGGEFAILMLVTLSEESLEGLAVDLQRLSAKGYKLTSTPAAAAHVAPLPGGRLCRIEVHGADHEGIVHQVAHFLSERGISIESAETETRPAPVSGTPLFTMTAQVAVPSELEAEDWEAGLAQIGDQMNLEIRVVSSGETSSVPE